MPIDKQSKQNQQKPITPALSSRFRTAARTPVAPRLAGSTTTSPAVTVRKDTRTGSVAEDAQTTPFGGHVTPRSGARSSRMGTESPGTPGNLQRPSNTGTVRSGSAISSPAAGVGSTRTVANNYSSGLPRRTSGTSTLSRRDDDDGKFVYAGDARPMTIPHAASAQHQQVSRPPMPGTARTDDGTIGHYIRLPVTTADATPTERNTNFIRANDIAASQPMRVAMPKQTPSSLTSSSQIRPNDSGRSPALTNTTSPRRPTGMSRSRPGSPVKNLIASPRIQARPDSPSKRRKSFGSSSVLSTNTVNNGRKKSISVSTVPHSHSNSYSTQPKLQLSPETPALPVLFKPQQLVSDSPTSPDTISPRSASLTSSRTAGTSGTSDTEVSDLAKIILAVQEFQIADGKETIHKQPSTSIPLVETQMLVPPTSTQRTQNQVQAHAQADAATARRERKVLDLEISNSSLLAINKTLERELRKQSAEIRRFRRLSRTGRLSLAPTNRSVSAQSMLSSLSEQVEDDTVGMNSSDDDDDEESDLSEPDDENQSDADSITARSRRRAREERRLMLDLSKHQQLLIDSQKLSQSIRKCLNLTEDLIQDGRKALDYKVGIGDVKLGGRVLSDDELNLEAVTHGYDHEEHDSRQGLLSPSLTKTEMQEAGMWQVDQPQNLKSADHHVASGADVVSHTDHASTISSPPVALGEFG